MHAQSSFAQSSGIGIDFVGQHGCAALAVSTIPVQAQLGLKRRIAITSNANPILVAAFM